MFLRMKGDTRAITIMKNRIVSANLSPRYTIPKDLGFLEETLTVSLMKVKTMTKTRANPLETSIPSSLKALISRKMKDVKPATVVNMENIMGMSFLFVAIPTFS